MKIKKVLLDTDIGDDIDDALALGYLGKSSDIFLLGVSTVFLKTRERAELGAAELQVLGKFNLPIVAGAGRPLKIENALYKKKLQEHKPRQFEILSKIKPLIKPYPMDVVEFLKNNIEAHSGEVTLLTIGPLTNIGLLFRKYPKIAEKLKEIVIMGGVITPSFPEWNILCDPEAAAIVFNAGAPIRMIGLDVTLKCLLPEAQIRRFEKSGRELPVLLGKLIRLWQKQLAGVSGNSKAHSPILHDPLAAMALNTPDLLEYRPCKIAVETGGKYTRGVTLPISNCWKRGKNGVEIVLNPKEKPNALVAVRVNAELAVKTFTERILS